MKNHLSRLAELREESDLTQRQVAEKVGVDVNTVRNWEKNRGGIENFVRVARLCELFKCQPGDLFKEERVC